MRWLAARLIRTRGVAPRDTLRREQNLVIIFGSEIRGGDVASLVAFGSGISGAKFICLGDYANSRGAADMGLYPDLLPGYHPIAETGNSTRSTTRSEQPRFPGWSSRKSGSWKSVTSWAKNQ